MLINRNNNETNHVMDLVLHLLLVMEMVAIIVGLLIMMKGRLSQFE